MTSGLDGAAAVPARPNVGPGGLPPGARCSLHPSPLWAAPATLRAPTARTRGCHMAEVPRGRDTASMLSITAAHSFCYVESDVPAGMTLSSWRGQKVHAEAGGRRPGLLRRRGR